MARKKAKKEELEVVAEVKEEVVETPEVTEEVVETPEVTEEVLEEPVVEEESTVEEEPVAKPQYKAVKDLNVQEYRHYLNTGNLPLI